MTGFRFSISTRCNCLILLSSFVKISADISSRNVTNWNQTIRWGLTYKMIPYINVLVPRMMHGVLSKFNSTLVVIIYWDAITDFHSHFFEHSTQIYSFFPHQRVPCIQIRSMRATLRYFLSNGFSAPNETSRCTISSPLSSRPSQHSQGGSSEGV